MGDLGCASKYSPRDAWFDIDRALKRKVSRMHFSDSYVRCKVLSDTVMNVLGYGLPRKNLLRCFETHWETLKVERIFTIPSHQVFI